jgi:hypothetical protein
VPVNRLAGHTHNLGNLLDFVSLPPHFLDSSDLPRRDVWTSLLPFFGEWINGSSFKHGLKDLLYLPQSLEHFSVRTIRVNIGKVVGFDNLAVAKKDPGNFTIRKLFNEVASRFSQFPKTKKPEIGMVLLHTTTQARKYIGNPPVAIPTGSLAGHRIPLFGQEQVAIRCRRDVLASQRPDSDPVLFVPASNSPFDGPKRVARAP